MAHFIVLNSFQHPGWKRLAGEDWTLKQVQGDDRAPSRRSFNLERS
jgi:hypothetical protein